MAVAVRLAHYYAARALAGEIRSASGACRRSPGPERPQSRYPLAEPLRTRPERTGREAPGREGKEAAGTTPLAVHISSSLLRARKAPREREGSMPPQNAPKEVRATVACPYQNAITRSAHQNAATDPMPYAGSRHDHAGQVNLGRLIRSTTTRDAPTNRSWPTSTPTLKNSKASGMPKRPKAAAGSDGPYSRQGQAADLAEPGHPASAAEPVWQRGRSVLWPVRYSSISHAAPRPSLIAHTTKLCPRRQSPAAYTPSTLVA